MAQNANPENPANDGFWFLVAQNANPENPANDGFCFCLLLAQTETLRLENLEHPDIPDNDVAHSEDYQFGDGFHSKNYQ